MSGTLLKRMCVAFLTYRWFYVFALAMGLILTATHFMTNDPGVSPGKIVAWSCVTAGIAGNYVGFYIQRHLAAPHSRVIPRFAGAHILFALSLNGALAALITTLATLAGPWSNMARLAVFAILWCVGSLWLSIGYIMRAPASASVSGEFWRLAWPWFLVWSLLQRPTLGPALSRLLHATPISTALGLLVTGTALSVFVGSKVLTQGDARRDRSPLQQGDSWESLGPVARKLFWNRTLAALDAIPQSVAGNFLSQVHVFRLTRQLVPRWVLFVMVLGGVSLGQLFGRQEFAATERPLLWGLYFALIPFVQAGMLANGGMDLRLISRLPLQKHVAIAAYGTSALALGLNLWITFIAAASTGALLPFGLGLKAFPSLEFVIASFAVHLAVFGVTAFASSLQASTPVQAIAALPLLAALGLTAWVVPASFFPLAAILFAMGLLWASYVLLCNAEMD